MRKCVQNPVPAMFTQRAHMEKQLVLTWLNTERCQAPIRASGAGRLQDLSDEKWRVEHHLQ